MTVGWYGKIPVCGDFIAGRLPPSFTQTWDGWLQEAMDGSRRRLGARWRENFLAMPVWHFVLSRGLISAEAWAGVMAPSVDSVGRYFPLTVAAALPCASLDLIGTLCAARSWFGDIEAIALSAIAPSASRAALDCALAQRAFRHDWIRHPRAKEDSVPMPASKAHMRWVAPRGLAERLPEAKVVWLTEHCEVFAPCLLLCESLPVPEQFCAMMDGRWLQHGWASR